MYKFQIGYYIFNTMEKQNKEVISIKDLYKSFGDLDVLKGINFNLFEGENVAVLGKSGTGKSVLIKMMVGLILSWLYL